MITKIAAELLPLLQINCYWNTKLQCWGIHYFSVIANPEQKRYLKARAWQQNHVLLNAIHLFHS